MRRFIPNRAAVVDLNEERAKELHESLIRSFKQVNEFRVDIVEKIEQACQYNLEELEIRIESLKIELDTAAECVNKRLGGYEKRLRTLNEEFKSKLDETAMFNDVSMRSLDDIYHQLRAHKRELFRCLRKRPFLVAVKFLSVDNFGKFPAYQDILANKRVLEKLQQEFKFKILGRNDVAQIRTYIKPPQIVEQIVKAACVAFDVRPSWKSFQNLSANQIIAIQANINVNNFSPESYSKLKEYVEGYGFSDYDYIRSLRTGPQEAAVYRLKDWVKLFYDIQRLKYEGTLPVNRRRFNEEGRF